MAIVETEALVLRTYNLAETDKIVVCLSRAAGLIRGVAKGARTLKNRYGAAFEPFTLLNLSYYQKETQELVSVRQVEILKSNFDLSSDPETLAGLAWMGDLISEFSAPHQANDDVFRMVTSCIETISDAPGDLQSVLRYFEVWLLRLEGFLPDIKRCADCHRAFNGNETVFVRADPGLRCDSCASVGGRALSKNVHAQLRTMLKLAPAAFAETSRTASAKCNRELARLMQQIISNVLERQPRTRPSYVLRTVEAKAEGARH